MKAGLGKQKIDPPVFKAFEVWFAENQGRYSAQVKILRRIKGRMHISIAGINPAIKVVLKEHEIAIYMEWKGEVWDILMEFDCMPKRALAGGYFCDLCPKETQKIFPTIDTLWEDHLFEPFGKWINEKLAKAKWIGLYAKVGGGITVAKLVSDVAQHGREFKGGGWIRKLVPLWLPL